MTLSHKMIIEWKGKYRLVAKNEKGLTTKFDAPLLFGGEEYALSPMENVLASLAACSSIHIISTLKEQEQTENNYWSVGAMLKKAVPISTSFKIIES